MNRIHEQLSAHNIIFEKTTEKLNYKNILAYQSLFFFYLTAALV